MTEYIKLEPCSIRDEWDKIRPGLEEIKERWPNSNTWRPEDVYAAVVNDDAVLYKTEDGFAICTLDTDRWTGDKDLFIWIAYSYLPGNNGMLQKYWPSFIEEAKRLGCKGIKTGSLHPALDSWNVMERIYTTYRYAITRGSR